MNQDVKSILIIIGLTILFFLPLVLSQIPARGADSYYFLNAIFDKGEINTTGTLPLATWLFSILPANILALKLIMLGVTILALIIYYFVGKKVSKGVGLIAPFLLLTSVFFSKIFIRFEDDIFALPFLFLALYFLICYVQQPTKKLFDKNIILSLIFLFIACNLWGYCIFFIPLFLIITNYHKLYWLAQVPLLFFISRIIQLLKPNFHVLENSIGLGLLALAIFGMIYLKRYRYQPLWIAIIVATVLTAINMKFLFITIPLICLAMVHYFELIPQATRKAVIYIFLTLFVFSIYLTYTSYPTSSDIKLLNTGQQLAIDTNQPYVISWSHGYVAKWYGYPVTQWGSYKPHAEKGVVFTTYGDEQITDCEIIDSTRYSVLAVCK